MDSTLLGVGVPLQFKMPAGAFKRGHFVFMKKNSKHFELQGQGTISDYPPNPE